MVACDKWQHVVVCMRCTEDSEIHYELESESENLFFPNLPVLLGSATLSHDSIWLLFQFVQCGQLREKIWVPLTGELLAWSCRAIHPEGAWLDLDEAFRDALLYVPTLPCFWLMGESKRMHRLCSDMAVAPFPACCVPSPCHFIWGSTVETLAHVIRPIYKLIKKINRRQPLTNSLGLFFRSPEYWIAEACTAVQTLLFRSLFDCSLKRRCSFVASVCGFILGQVYASTSGDEYPRDGAGYPGSKAGPVYPSSFYMQGVWMSTTYTRFMER